MASAAAQIPIPKEVELKEKKDFKLIGTSRKNVDWKKNHHRPTFIWYRYA